MAQNADASFPAVKNDQLISSVGHALLEVRKSLDNVRMSHVATGIIVATYDQVSEMYATGRQDQFVQEAKVALVTSQPKMETDRLSQVNRIVASAQSQRT
jgi:hypothetical protein